MGQTLLFCTSKRTKPTSVSISKLAPPSRAEKRILNSYEPLLSRLAIHLLLYRLRLAEPLKLNILFCFHICCHFVLQCTWRRRESNRPLAFLNMQGTIRQRKFPLMRSTQKQCINHQRCCCYVLKLLHKGHTWPHPFTILLHPKYRSSITVHRNVLHPPVKLPWNMGTSPRSFLNVGP